MDKLQILFSLSLPWWVPLITFIGFFLIAGLAGFLFKWKFLLIILIINVLIWICAIFLNEQITNFILRYVQMEDSQKEIIGGLMAIVGYSIFILTITFYIDFVIIFSWLIIKFIIMLVRRKKSKKVDTIDEEYEEEEYEEIEQIKKFDHKGRWGGLTLGVISAIPFTIAATTFVSFNSNKSKFSNVNHKLLSSITFNKSLEESEVIIDFMKNTHEMLVVASILMGFPIERDITFDNKTYTKEDLNKAAPAAWDKASLLIKNDKCEKLLVSLMKLWVTHLGTQIDVTREISTNLLSNSGLESIKGSTAIMQKLQSLILNNILKDKNGTAEQKEKWANTLSALIITTS